METVIKKSKNQSYIAMASHDCDLSQALYDPKLSEANFEEESHLFYSTFDYLQHSSLVDRIKKILEAHGYVLNLENILYCIERLWFVNFVELGLLSQKKASNFMPGVYFNLPQKGKAGYLVNLFYDEIHASIQAQKHEVKSSEQIFLEDQSLLVKQQKDRIAQLEKQVAMLLDQVSEQGGGFFKRKEEIKVDDLEKKDLIFCHIESVNFDERHVLAKDKKSSYKIPFYLLNFLPTKDDPCFVKLDKNKEVICLMFPFVSHNPLTQVAAKITNIMSRHFRVSCKHHGFWQLKIDNEVEYLLLKECHVNQEVVALFSEQNLVKILPLKWSKLSKTMAVKSRYCLLDIKKNRKKQRG